MTFLESTALQAVVIFIITYVAIISEKIPRTICALVGGCFMICFGLVSQDEAIKRFIDFNTLGLLAGMMVLISIVKKTGFFEAIALWSVKKSRGNTKILFVLLSLLTGIGAALIDSVTAAFMIAPMTISICRMIRISPLPIMISEVIMSNIGGTALMIGNPPNVMIGSATSLDFMDFMLNLAPIAILTMLVSIGLVMFVYRKNLNEARLTDKELSYINVRTAINDVKLLKKALLVLSLTILGFMLHSKLGLQSATIAISGAILSIIICHINVEEACKEIDLNTLLFFMGLFILVGGLETTGVIEDMAKLSIGFVDGDVKVMTYLILGLSGVASAFIDNIPFTATMIPLIHSIQGILGLEADFLWWSLAIGSCFGGNGTLIGASSNVVIMGEACKYGYNISFIRFMWVCFPIMLFTLLISGVYIELRYF